MDRPVTQAKTAGFTLIEVMIAVAVLGVLSVTVVLSVNRPAGESDRVGFERAFDQMQARAVLGQRFIALDVSSAGYQRLMWQAGWVSDGAPVTWRNVQVLEPFGGQPVVFGPGGQSTPLELRFGAQSCRSDGWTGLICAR